MDGNLRGRERWATAPAGEEGRLGGRLGQELGAEEKVAGDQVCAVQSRWKGSGKRCEIWLSGTLGQLREVGNERLLEGGDREG